VAFSLKSLLPGGTKKTPDSDGAEVDDTFAPEVQEIPETEIVDAESARDGKGAGLGALVARLGGIMAKGPAQKAARNGANRNGAKKKKKKGRAAKADDPFDNPEVLAVIAQEVASLPPPDLGEEDTAEPEAPRPDATPPAAPDLTLGETAGGGEADPLTAMTTGEDALADDDFGALPGDEDDEAARAYRQRQRQRALIGSAAAAGLLVVLGLGTWWMLQPGPEAPPPDYQLTVRNEDARAPRKPASGDRIVMSMPPPPDQAPATRSGGRATGNGATGNGATGNGATGTERSLTRRPWLKDGATGAGGPGAEAVPAPPASDSAPAERGGEAPGDAAPAKGTPPKDTATKDTAAEPAPAAPGEAVDVAAPDLPPLKEPAIPAWYGQEDKTPAYADLTVPRPAPEPLADAPIARLAERTRAGLLPVKAVDGAVAWQTYGRPFAGPEAAPRVALIVADLGLNADATEAAITRLPPAVTLAFSPYAPNLDALVKKARAHGHEVLLSLPLEPKTFPAWDPGPLALMTALPQAQNMDRLETVMAKATGYTGLIGRYGGAFGASRVHMRTVLEEMARRGLLYIHTADRAGLAENRDVPAAVAQATLRIDARMFKESIDARLAYLGEVAKTTGRAIGVATPTPLTFQRIETWAAGLAAAKDGVHLAPASAVVAIPAR